MTGAPHCVGIPRSVHIMYDAICLIYCAHRLYEQYWDRTAGTACFVVNAACWLYNWEGRVEPMIRAKAAAVAPMPAPPRALPAQPSASKQVKAAKTPQATAKAPKPDSKANKAGGIEAKFCVHCGHSLQKGANFCGECGRKQK